MTTWRDELKESIDKRASKTEEAQSKIERELASIIGKELNSLEFLRVRQLVDDYERNEKYLYQLNDRYAELA